MKKFLSRKNLLILAILILAVVWAGKGIFKYNVFSTHDGNHHFARSFDAIRTIKEGHFPLRWAGSLNYSCGVPIYNFFYPLIYYLVILLNFLTNDIFLALKIINFGSLLIGTLFFYLWMRKETKGELPAVGSAILYLYAPYRFSLIFVRGSPEFLAYAILPVVLYGYTLLFESKGKRIVFYSFLTALAGGLLAISHNFTVMFLVPIILLYLVIKAFVNKVSLKKIIWAALAFVSSFGFGAFFIGPAVLEKEFTKIGDNFLSWREHFPTLEQLIKSKWGYFYSSLGTHNDGMSFMLGYAHWVVLGLAILWIIYSFVKTRRLNLWVGFFSIVSSGTIYLILPWSIPVWEKFGPLQEIQFSWRLLGIAIFTISALFGFLLSLIKNQKIAWLLFIAISALAIYGNRNHLLPQPVSVEDLYRYDDFEKLHPHRHSTTTLGDDVIAKNAEKACWFSDDVIVSEEKEIPQAILTRGNTHGSLKFKGGGLMTLNLGYFPGAYQIEVNGLPVDYQDCRGRVCIDVQMNQENNFLSWKIVQTPIQSSFNKVTLLFLAVWLLVLSFTLTKYKPKPMHLALLGAFVLFAFFRFTNLDHRIGFGWDHERDAWAVKEILSGDMKLIGPRVLGPAGFFLPPYFFYLLVPFYLISNLHPDAILYFLVAETTAFFAVAFLVLRKIFNEKVALVFVALWAVNPLAISIDTVGWNPNLIPLALIFLLYVVIRKRLFLAGLILGLGTSFHFQFLLALPAILPLVIDRQLTKKSLKILAGFSLPFIPILIFDLRNNFLNLKLLREFVSGGGTRDLLAFWDVWERVTAFSLGVDVLPGLGILFYLGVLGLLLWRVRHTGLTLTWAFFPLFFALYGSRPSEYYFNYLLPIAIIALAYFFTRIFKKWRLSILILSALLIYWGARAFPLTKTNGLSLYYKDKTARFLSIVTKEVKPFNISFDVPLSEDAGFRYLLDYYQVPYSGEPKDPLIEVAIPPERKTEIIYRAGSVGVYIPRGWLKGNWVK